MRIAACIPTRGDVDLDPIIRSLPESWEVVVWDNSKEGEDLAVYGRYAAIWNTEAEVIYTQDDDCVLAPSSLVMLEAAYQPGIITANMPDIFRAHYGDSCLIGFGAIFHRDLPTIAFNRVKPVGADTFTRTCDVYFTTLTKHRWLDLSYENLPWASDENRMWKQPTHIPERRAALEQARRIRDEG